MPNPSPKTLSFLDGFSVLPRALAMLVRRPRLLFWMLLPLVITLALDIFAFVSLEAWLRGVLYEWLPSGMLFRVVRWLLELVGGVFLYFILHWSFVLVFVTLSGPFQDFISEEVEAQLTGRPVDDPAGMKNVLWGIGQSLWQMVVLLFWQLLFLLLALVPLVGPPLYFVFSVITLGYAFFTIPAGRKLHDISSRWSLTRQHLGCVFALGLACFAAELLPWVSVAALPVFVVAGTILFHTAHPR